MVVTLECGASATNLCKQRLFCVSGRHLYRVFGQTSNKFVRQNLSANCVTEPWHRQEKGNLSHGQQPPGQSPAVAVSLGCGRRKSRA